MSAIEDAADETTSSSEDEEPELDEAHDKYFFQTLSCLKNKDPKIYDPKVVFFPKNDGVEETKLADKTKKKDAKPIFLRDYEREQVIKVMENGGDTAVVGESELPEEELPYVVQQKNIKASFKAALEDSESDDEDGLLKVKTKTAEEMKIEEDDYKEWLKGNKEELDDKEVESELKPLHDFWSKPDLDSKEQFLRDYILNRRYLEDGEEAEDDGISEDGELLEMQEKFETEYNMRFENDTNVEIKRYPRVIEGSLRKKDEGRSEKRKRRLEKKRLEKEKKKQEITKKQKDKLKEFKEQIEKLKKLTGNDQLGFKDEEIFGDQDFDPDAHDKKMQELYSDAFYSAGAEDAEKPEFGDDDDIAGPEDSEIYLDDGDPDNMDLEPEESNVRRSKKETRSKKKRKEKKKKAFTDIMDIVKPVFDPQVHNSYQKYIDEYYAMDCEDFIEDIPCRFKYRTVVPNDYGLSVEEILTADDKELNQWVSAKKITKLRPEHVEKNEVKIYRKKGQDYNLKKKILSSIYGSPMREDDESGQSVANSPPTENETLRVIEKSGKKRALDEPTNELDEAMTKKRKRKKNQDSVPNATSDGPSPSPSARNEADRTSSFQKKKKFKNNRGNRNKTGCRRNTNDQIVEVSDLRLKAYDIKPREFKKKMKYKK